MLDILLRSDGDIKVTENGDIRLTESVAQSVRIHLKWILGEWRLGEEIGFPWFEDVLVKNPDLEHIKNLIRSEIMGIDGVRDAKVTDAIPNAKKRTVVFRYVVTVGDEIFKEEVELGG